MSDIAQSTVFPVLPLRDIVVFPHMIVPLFVGREKSIHALEEVMKEDKQILLVAQKNASQDDPGRDDIYRVGTVSSVLQLLKLPDGTVKVLVEGKSRARIGRYIDHDKYFLVEAELLEPAPVSAEDEAEISALMRSVQQTFENYVKLNKRVPPELAVSVQSIDNPSRMADTIAAHVNFKLTAKQELLETESIRARLEKLYELMQNEIEILQVEKKIRTRVKKQMEKNQKEYYLNEQMQAIQKELGSQDEFKNEIAELEERVRRRKMSAEAADRLKKELRKLKMMSPMSAEATVVRNYIDTVLALPWDERTVEKLDIAEAESILDADHYGLEKPKERIIEYLAVRSLVPKLKGPILCLVGPPGVGKSFACVQWLLAYARVGKTIRWEQCSAWAVGKAFDQARERMLAAHALVLDDFGRGPVSAWAIEQLNAIACTRFDSGKRTLVSSNAAHYSVKAGADREVMPLCGEPLISRMQGRIREVGGAELRGRDDGLVLAARDRARALLELVGVTDSAELPVWPGQRQQDRPLPSYDDVRFGGVLATRLHAAESDAGPTLPERDDNAEARAAIDAARSAAKREIVGQVCRELELDPREVSRLAAKLERESTDRAGLDALAEAMRKLAPKRENTTLWLLSVKLTVGAAAGSKMGKLAEYPLVG